jgi:hypothetical protein
MLKKLSQLQGKNKKLMFHQLKLINVKSRPILLTIKSLIAEDRQGQDQAQDKEMDLKKGHHQGIKGSQQKTKKYLMPKLTSKRENYCRKKRRKAKKTSKNGSMKSTLLKNGEEKSRNLIRNVREMLAGRR